MGPSWQREGQVVVIRYRGKRLFRPGISGPEVPSKGTELRNPPGVDAETSEPSYQAEGRRDHRPSAVGRRIRRVPHSDHLLSLPFQTQGRELMPKQVTAPRFLRLPEVLNLVGVTRSTLYRWMEAGTFPKQISVGGNTVVWVESAVTDWMQDQIAKQ